MAGEKTGSISTAVQVVSVVAGVVVSVLSVNISWQKEAEARKIEAAKPFLELRQAYYKEAVRVAAILANPSSHTDPELLEARKRFRALYVAELSMVEPCSVETAMQKMAEAVEPQLDSFTPAQAAAYDLAHALRDSFVQSYGLGEAFTEKACGG
jgi:hypothetical protein